VTSSLIKKEMPKRKKYEDELEVELAAEEEEEDALERAALALSREENGSTAKKSVKTKLIDANGLESATSLAWGSDKLPWIEHLVLSSDLDTVSGKDDLEREVAIYKLTLSCVADGRSRLELAGEPFLRPKDFFCEMIKSDAHMAKVKDELIFQQKKMDAFEKRKERQQQLKFAKAVQAEKQKQKIQRKKEAVKKIEDFRKQGAGASKRLGLDESEPSISSTKKKKSPSKKRQALDKKWGFGGKKSGKKRNDAKSINDLSDFRPTRGKSTAKGSRGTFSSVKDNNNSPGNNKKKSPKQRRIF